MKFFKENRMRNLWFILLFLPFLSFSQVNQTDANGLRQGLWQKQQPNGKPLYEGYFKNDKPVGEWKRYHENGRVKAIISYQLESDSAFTQIFDEAGKKIAEGFYLNEKKVGTWKYFFDNRLIADEQYNDGQKDGVSHTYYNTGEKLNKIN